MENLMLFLSAFCSYLVKYIVYIVAIVIACFIGIGLRKSSNAKKAAKEGQPENSEKAESN